MREYVVILNLPGNKTATKVYTEDLVANLLYDMYGLNLKDSRDIKAVVSRQINSNSWKFENPIKFFKSALQKENERHRRKLN